MGGRGRTFALAGKRPLPVWPAVCPGLCPGRASALRARAASILPSRCRPISPPKPIPSAVRISIAAMSTRADAGFGATASASAAGAGSSAVVAALAMSERGYQVVELWGPARLLDFGDAAAAAIGDARLGDLVVGDGVVGGDVARTHDAGHAEHAQLEVHPHLLGAADDEIAVRQNVGDDRRHQQLDALRPGDRAGPLGGRARVDGGVELAVALAREERVVEVVGGIEVQVALGVARALGRVVEGRLVLDRDLDGHDVADAGGARVADEIGAGVLPERVAAAIRTGRLRIAQYGHAVGPQPGADRGEARLAPKVPDLVRAAAERQQASHCEHELVHDFFSCGPACGPPAGAILAAPLMMAVRRAAWAGSLSFKILL